MPRKNFARKSDRRAHRAELPILLTDVLSDVEAVWLVTVRKGTAQRQVEIQGTQATAWSYAEVCSSRRDSNLFGYIPVDIMHLRSVEYGQAFAIA